MGRHLVTVLLFIAAFAAYLAGWAGGEMALVAVGVVLVVWFWIRVISGKARHQKAWPVMK